MACSSKPWVSTRTCRFLPLISSFPACIPMRIDRGPPFGALHALTWIPRRSGWPLAGPTAYNIHRLMRDAVAPACRPGPSFRMIVHCAPAAAGPWGSPRRPPVSARTCTPFTASGGYQHYRLLPPGWPGGCEWSPWPIRHHSDRFHSAIRVRWSHVRFSLVVSSIVSVRLE